jgi:hypothetical protein
MVYKTFKSFGKVIGVMIIANSTDCFQSNFSKRFYSTTLSKHTHTLIAPENVICNITVPCFTFLCTVLVMRTALDTFSAVNTLPKDFMFLFKSEPKSTRFVRNKSVI